MWVNAPQAVRANWDERMRKAKRLEERGMRINKFGLHGSWVGFIMTLSAFVVKGNLFSKVGVVISISTMFLIPITFFCSYRADKIMNEVMKEVRTYL